MKEIKQIKKVKKNPKVYVIGHKNPDSDSICSAIAFANLKSDLDNTKRYRAYRAGSMNNETKFVLKSFEINEPKLCLDVFPRVKNIDIRQITPLSPDTSIKKAWTMMGDLDIVTLAIVDEEDTLIGLITAEDIALANMDNGMNDVFENAKVPFENAIEVLSGKLVVDNGNRYLNADRISIDTCNWTDVKDIEKLSGIIITSSRSKEQYIGLIKHAKCVILCSGVEISNELIDLAVKNKCAIITTNKDVYETAKVLHQSIPVSYFMTTPENIYSFKLTTPIDDARELMGKVRKQYFPVLDEKDKYYGLISRRNLMNFKRINAVLVDHNEITQAVRGIELANVLAIIDHHRIGNLETVTPILFRNQPVGSTCTIVYQMYIESNVAITRRMAGIMCAGILSDTLMFQSPTCTEVDKIAAEYLAKVAEINMVEFAEQMFAAGSDIAGKTAKELFYQDFKKFEHNGKTFGIGQGSFSSMASIKDAEKLLVPYLDDAIKNEQVDMIFFMLTDIIHASTRLIYIGAGAEKLLKATFPDSKKRDRFELPGVVSRKKQVVPPIIHALQEDVEI